MREDIKSECLRIGLNIMICRKRLNLLQEDISRMTGISRSQISSMERGDSNFKLKNLIIIAEAMNIDYREMLR